VLGTILANATRICKAGLGPKPRLWRWRGYRTSLTLIGSATIAGTPHSNREVLTAELPYERRKRRNSNVRRYAP